MKLNIKAFSFTCAIIWGLGIFLITWWLVIIEGSGGTTFIGRVYLGYEISPLGSIIGLIWGLVDGLIGGAIFAWLYNRLTPGTASQ
jgi:hypothetical protein